MADANHITKEYLQEMYEYRDGELYSIKRKPRNKNGYAGAMTANGYRRTSIKGKWHLTHRLIFLFHYGYLPEFIDHIDGNKINNNINNLRPATRSQNMYNIGARSHGSSGYKNISWHKNNKSWNVVISINKKNKHFGSFNSLDDAIVKASEVRKQICKEFAKD